MMAENLRQDVQVQLSKAKNRLVEVGLFCNFLGFFQLKFQLQFPLVLPRVHFRV